MLGVRRWLPTMKKTLGVMVSMLAFAALAMPAERWIHIRVIESGPDGDRVRINIPLSLAEAVLPTIKADKLCEGKVKLEGRAFDKVDLRALLQAVGKAQDNRYVTVESKDENVEVAKAGEFLLIKVHENREGAGKTAGAQKAANIVDIKIPFKVANALLSGNNDELNVLAAVRALGEYPSLELVTVKDESDNVRIWVDSSNNAD
jgi:hypothetical protein